MTTAADPTSVTLEELLTLRLTARQLRLKHSHALQHASGSQKSHRYGRGMDYAESRAYQPGDDIRRLDWRLTARSGKLHTKLFQEDHQGCLLILLDCHASMNFATRGRFKSVQAARAAALAAWQTSHLGEQVGLLSFGQGCQLVKPASGHKGALAICHALADAKPAKASTSLTQALGQLKRLGARPSRLLLISDGLNLSDEDLKRLAQLRRGSQLSLLGVADALELAAPPAGRYHVSLAGKHLSLSLFGRQRQRFFRQLNQGQQRLRDFARRHGLVYQPVACDRPVIEALQPLMRGHSL